MSFLELSQALKNMEVQKTKAYSAFDMPDMHAHPFHELYFLLSGKRRYFIGHRIYDVFPGDLVVVPANELHQTTALDRHGHERYVLYFRESMLDELAGSVGKENIATFLNFGCVQLPSEHTEHILKNLEQLEREKVTPDRYTDIVQKNILYDIIITALRFGSRKTNAPKENIDKIQEAARYISEHYNSDISLQDTAKRAYMEYTYFSKMFKALTGFCFSEYLIQTRIKAATSMLETTSLSISEISEKCGFSGSNYFGDIFKKYKGVSPSKYRKHHIAVQTSREETSTLSSKLQFGDQTWATG